MCSEFLRRNAERRIAEVNKRYQKRFVNPSNGIFFYSSKYQKLANGNYKIFDNPRMGLGKPVN